MSESSEYQPQEMAITDSDQDFEVSQCQSQYQISQVQLRSIKRKRRMEKLKKNKKFGNEGTWTLQENLKYKVFLEENSSLFQTNTSTRRIIKINVQISNAVKSRSPDQCRSHHQKMIKYHRTVPRIISFIDSLALAHQEKLAQESIREKMDMLVDPIEQMLEYSMPELALLNLVYEEERVESRGISEILDDMLWYDGQPIW